MAFDKEMSGTIAMRALFKQPSLDAVPGVDDFLFIPELPDAAILVSSVGTATLAEGVRAIFPNRLFVLSAVTEVDGFLPKAAWEFIQAHGNNSPFR